MRKIIISLLSLGFLLSGCVVIEYGDFRYTRFMEDQSLSDLTITTPDGTVVTLGKKNNTGKMVEAVESAITILNAIPK